MSNSFQPHGISFTISQSLSHSCPLSWWCHPTISSSVAPFSSCLQSFPASESFLVNQLFASGGQSIGAWASASVLWMNIQGWFPFGLASLISLLLKGLESSLASHFESMNSSALSPLCGLTLTSVHSYWKNHSLTIWTLSAKWLLCLVICCLVSS